MRLFVMLDSIATVYLFINCVVSQKKMSPHFHICSLNNGTTVARIAAVAVIIVVVMAAAATAATSAIYYKILLVKNVTSINKKIIHCAPVTRWHKKASTNPKSKIWRKVKGSGEKKRREKKLFNADKSNGIKPLFLPYTHRVSIIIEPL